MHIFYHFLCIVVNTCTISMHSYKIPQKKTYDQTSSLSHKRLHSGEWSQHFFICLFRLLAWGQGVEPRLTGPEPVVLPLDDPQIHTNILTC